MTRRVWFLSLLFTGACTGSPGGSAAPADPAARVARLAGEVRSAYAERYPAAAMLDTGSEVLARRITDNSPRAAARWWKRENGWLEALASPRDSLPPDAPQAVTVALLRETLEASVALRACRTDLWDVNPLTGWPTALRRLAATPAPATAPEREAVLGVWRRIGPLLDTDVIALREGLRLGYSAPVTSARAVVAQADSLLGPSLHASVLLGPSARDTAGGFGASLTRVVSDTVVPALERYRDFLRQDYVKRARAAAAISANPDGEACYQASVRAATGLDLAPRAIHDLGLRQLALVEEEMRDLASRGSDRSDVPGLIAAFDSGPALPGDRGAEARARAALPRWFEPRADSIVPAPRDFPDPVAPVSREVTVFEDRLPGAALQARVARGAEGLHPLPRGLGQEGFRAGWALYAGRLADEMGLYTSDTARMGMLLAEARAATALVVDPGLHVLGWSPGEAEAYLVAHALESPAAARATVNRELLEPGRATALLLGRLAITRARDDARARLGSRFDIRRFHREVLKAGALPLPLLTARIARWVAAGGD